MLNEHSNRSLTPHFPLSAYPVVRGKPTIRIEETTPDQFSFHCDFVPLGDLSVDYAIRWLVGDTVVEEHTVNGTFGISSVTLPDGTASPPELKQGVSFPACINYYLSTCLSYPLFKLSS